MARVCCVSGRNSIGRNESAVFAAGLEWLACRCPLASGSSRSPRTSRRQWAGSARLRHSFALAVVGIVSADAQTVRSAYVAMAPITSLVIVPFCFAALFTCIVQGLGTAWGLFRYRWVVAKLLLTVEATVSSQSRRLVRLIMMGVVPFALLSAEQRAPEVSRIGYMGLRPLNESAASMESITALKEGLGDLGHVEGKDYVLDVRIANNNPARYPELTDELSNLQVKLIVAASTPAAVAIHKANPTMPLVVRGPDIIGAGLADSASRPGGVTTGIDELGAGIVEKRLRLLKQTVPAISRVAVLSSAPTESGHVQAFAEAERAAQAIGVTLRRFKISATTDLAAIFAGLRSDAVDAVYCSGGVLPRPVQQRIVELAAHHRLPAMYPVRDYVELGGLMSYAYRNTEMFRALATYVDKILKGAKPGELPLTMWDQNYLTVNARTAATLNITVPATILSQADVLK